MANCSAPSNTSGIVAFAVTNTLLLLYSVFCVKDIWEAAYSREYVWVVIGMIVLPVFIWVLTGLSWSLFSSYSFIGNAVIVIQDIGSVALVFTQIAFACMHDFYTSEPADPTQETSFTIPIGNRYLTIHLSTQIYIVSYVFFLALHLAGTGLKCLGTDVTFFLGFSFSRMSIFCVAARLFLHLRKIFSDGCPLVHRDSRIKLSLVLAVWILTGFGSMIAFISGILHFFKIPGFTTELMLGLNQVELFVFGLTYSFFLSMLYCMGSEIYGPEPPLAGPAHVEG